MEISAHGGNCLTIKVNKTKFVVDPAKDGMGITNPKLKDVVAILTNDFETIDVEELVSEEVDFTITTPGEYEIHNVNIVGIMTPSMLDVHDDSDGDTVYNTAYSLRADAISVGILGHPAQKLSDKIYETLGTVDVLVCPIGGGGLTLDPIAASKIVKDIDPTLVVPVHYNQSGIIYESPQSELDEFLSELGVPVREENKLKVKKSDLGETLEIIKLKI